MGTVEQKRTTPQGNRASAKYGATTRFDLLYITRPQTVLSRCIWKTRWVQAARRLRKDGHEGTARGCKKRHCKSTEKQCLMRNLPTQRAAVWQCMRAASCRAFRAFLAESLLGFAEFCRAVVCWVSRMLSRSPSGVSRPIFLMAG